MAKKGKLSQKKEEKVSKKVENKEKQKVIQDRTFGLKNKNKSKKVQVYMKGVQDQVLKGGSKKVIERDRRQKEIDEAAQREDTLMRELFKQSVVQPKVPAGVDPKSFVCEFFKRGICKKGDKCKFSHDLDVIHKADKIDAYTDRRALDEDVMDDWDQDKLEKVVDLKRSNVNRNLKTKIVCKHFVAAVDNRQYGWFWECPNGGDKCLYVHALPPGYILTKKIKKDAENEPVVIIEEVLDAEIAKIQSKDKVTLEKFSKWKVEKERKKKEEEKKKKRELKEKERMSGRALLLTKPEFFKDDEEAMEDYVYSSDEEEEENSEDKQESSPMEETENDNCDVLQLSTDIAEKLTTEDEEKCEGSENKKPEVDLYLSPESLD